MQKEQTTSKTNTRRATPVKASKGNHKSTTDHRGSSGSRTNSNGPSGSSNGHNGNSNSQTGEQGSVADSRLEEFFVDELKDIYWAEKKLVKTLPKLQKAATSKELQDAFASHLKETEGHVERLEKAFGLLGKKAVAKKCDAMEGITEEGKSIIEDTEKGTATRDVALVLAGQKAEHYEIATYGGLSQLARTLGHDEVAQLLEQTLQEEKNADQKLTSIAESKINYSAAGEKK